MSDRHIHVIKPVDNVATALREINAGEDVSVAVNDENRSVVISDDVEFGHKIALEKIIEGNEIIKYGKSIGNASQDILAGEWVHVHNVDSNYGRGDLAEEAKTQGVNE